MYTIPTIKNCTFIMIKESFEEEKGGMGRGFKGIKIRPVTSIILLSCPLLSFLFCFTLVTLYLGTDNLTFPLKKVTQETHQGFILTP